MKIDRKTSFLDLSDNPLSAKAIVGVISAAKKQVRMHIHMCVYTHARAHTHTHTDASARTHKRDNSTYIA